MRDSPTPLRAPRDGIHSSQRRRGWLADAWIELLQDFKGANRQRVARGRGLARAGRVRDLWFSPGLANAEVVERETRHVSLRVRVFDEAAWKRAVKLLKNRLDFVAALLEGELPKELVDTFAKAKLPLIPSAKDFDGDCDCGDYAMPCTHMAAVFVLLADALDGDPFLLLTLRGRPREQVLAALRSSWGDRKPLLPGKVVDTEPCPPAGDWFTSPVELPPMDFQPRFEQNGPPTGLRELGPPPGDEDLERALLPLYECGAELADAIAMQEGPAPAPRRSFQSATTEAAPRRVSNPTDARRKLSYSFPPGAVALPDEADDAELSEGLLELLADGKGYRARALADQLAASLQAVRRELRKLEEHQAVRRTGRTRGTRWWLVE